MFETIPLLMTMVLAMGVMQRAGAAPKEDSPNSGFVVCGRPMLPLTLHDYSPGPGELSQPARLRLAAGEAGSAVIFVRALDKDLVLRASPSPLISKAGYGIENGYGARSIYLRVAEDAVEGVRDYRTPLRPEFLINSDRLSVEAHDGGQFWLTVEVPANTPPGDYEGSVGLTPIDPETDEQSGESAVLPVILTVRDLKLEEPDVAFGTWYHSAPRDGPQGPEHILPRSDLIYLLDQQQHGMNMVAAYCKAQRKDENGEFHISYNELDLMVATVEQAGLCRTQPLILLMWRDDMVGGEFGSLAGGPATAVAIHEHAKEAGWPEVLFTVLDEPGLNTERVARVEEVMRDYEEARRRGLRTVVAQVHIEELGDLYDVWIQKQDSDLPAAFELAEQRAEVWMYDYVYTGRNPLYERFYAGLWTWRTGVRGNMVWSYG